MRFLVGLFLVIGSLLGAYFLEGGEPWHLLSLSACVITVLIPLFAVLAVWPARRLARSWVVAFQKGTDDETATAVSLWKFAEAACYLAGVLASLTGGVLIMGNFAGADAEHLAHSFGALLVAPTYGTLLGLVCRILRARVEAEHRN